MSRFEVPEDLLLLTCPAPDHPDGWARYADQLAAHLPRDLHLDVPAVPAEPAWKTAGGRWFPARPAIGAFTARFTLTARPGRGRNGGPTWWYTLAGPVDLEATFSAQLGPRRPPPRLVHAAFEPFRVDEVTTTPKQAGPPDPLRASAHRALARAWVGPGLEGVRQLLWLTRLATGCRDGRYSAQDQPVILLSAEQSQLVPHAAGLTDHERAVAEALLPDWAGTAADLLGTVRAVTTG